MIVMKWNFDMNSAPKDKSVITASSCKKVIVSKWIEEGQRWNMYTRESPPVAWCDFPAHPYDSIDFDSMF